MLVSIIIHFYFHFLVHVVDLFSIEFNRVRDKTPPRTAFSRCLTHYIVYNKVVFIYFFTVYVWKTVTCRYICIEYAVFITPAFLHLIDSRSRYEQRPQNPSSAFTRFWNDFESILIMEIHARWQMRDCLLLYEYRNDNGASLTQQNVGYIIDVIVKKKKIIIVILFVICFCILCGATTIDVFSFLFYVCTQKLYRKDVFPGSLHLFPITKYIWLALWRGRFSIFCPKEPEAKKKKPQ